MARSYRGGVEIVVNGVNIETATAVLSTYPPTPEGITRWGGTLRPSGGRPLFNQAFLSLHGVFTIRLQNGREAQVVKRATLIRPPAHQRVEIAQASGDPAPF
jgi:hypothetical protein